MNLGFNEDDAPRLYEEKDNWMCINSGGKVLCVVQGCKFETPIASDKLFEHCRIEHKWKDYPCPEENCKLVAYSSFAFKRHVLFHTRKPKTHHQFSCSQPNCQWTFENRWKLLLHENIHDNILLKCVYCPYTCVQDIRMSMHQRDHFNIRDFKCDICDKTFEQNGEVTTHFKTMHSGVTTKCFVCDYEGNVSSVRSHLNQKHGILGYSWDAKNEKFVKM